MKRIHSSCLSSEESHKSNSSEKFMLKTSASDECYVTFDAETMKRIRLDSDTDCEDDSTDDPSSECYSDGRPSGQQNFIMSDNCNEREDVTRKMNDSGFINTSLNGEIDSDVYQQLLAFSQTDPSNILTNMLEPNFELGVVLDDINVNTSCLFVFMKIICTICESNSPSKIDILLKMAKSSLPRTIRHFLQKIIDDDNPIFTFDILSFVNHLVKFYSSVFILIPEVMVTANFKEIILKTIHVCENLNKCSLDTFFSRFKLNDLLAKIESYPMKLPQPDAALADFQRFSFYPSSADLHSGGYTAESNLTRGMYVDAQHYLSVHFHLLHQCFHESIKVAIQNYLNSSNQISARPLTITVQFHQIHFKRRTLCCELKIQSDFKVELPESVYGLLVAFSNDNFVSFFFGVIEEWNASSCSLFVSFIDVADVWLRKIFSSPHTIVITSVNLPRYNYPALMKALTSKNDGNLPLIRYLINAESDMQSPSAHTEVELRNRHRSNAVLQLFAQNQLIMFHDVWLDVFEYLGLKAALSDPVTLIAGPRGTGKTFLASKIVHVLLHDSTMRSTVKRWPILTIFRSNETLDEFLRFARNTTSKLVRIGGCTSNTRLQYLNLRALRKSSPVAATQNASLFKLRRQIKNVAEEITKIDEQAGIVSFSVLKNVMAPKYRSNMDEQRLLALLLDEAGFTFEYAKSTGNLEERLDTSVWAELDLCKTIKNWTKPAGPVAAHEIIGGSQPSHVDEQDAADEFFIDDVESDSPSVADDKSVESVMYALTEQKCAELYQQNVSQIEIKFNQLNKNSNVDRKELYFIVEHVQKLRRNLYILQTELKNLRDTTAGLSEAGYHELQQKDFHSLSFPERWMLYRFWVTEVRNRYVYVLQEDINRYEKEVQKFERMSDLEVLSEAHVIGITTACLSKFQSYFEILQPSVVIVEDATEIIEAEIIAPLTSACEQLILLGDLHSMKPSTPNLQFSKNHHMDVSLFERLMNNGFSCHRLKIQRDIPPEINSILNSTFVTDLYRNVNMYTVGLPKVKGIAKNVFFLNHNLARDDESETNADFISKMCLYLLKQKVAATEITILSMTKKQTNILKTTLNTASNLKSICVTSIDNFRNKLNKIVIISFGAIQTKIMDADDKNRLLYTALTRATLALYMVGDVNYLSRNFDNWSSVQKNLEKWAAIGNRIILTCEKHHKVNPVSITDSFWNGCGEVCGDILPCRHSCSFPCHLDDAEHVKNFVCQNRIESTCSSGHVYKTKCGLGYRPCPIIITTSSRFCGHAVTKKCGDCVYSSYCSQMCNEMLPCGHRCLESCHRYSDPMHKKTRCKSKCGKTHTDCTHNHVCEKLCWERCGICFKMESCVLNCGHKTTKICSYETSRLKCYEKCLRICEKCGVKCQKYCFEECQPCSNEVLKFIDSCGHEKLMECGTLPESSLCDEWINLYTVATPCGHNQLHLPCRLKTENPAKLSQYCSVPCDALLLCGHTCVGTCGSCFCGRMHSGCDARCETTFVCGHRCESMCEQTHLLCDKTCAYYCQHQKCNAECGLPCFSCKVPCEWRCKHRACTRTCSEFCDCTPCCEPCDQYLACGHPCIGFCGEPCPPLCRFCDVELLAINYPDDINDPETRFVLLADCQHVVESRLLEEHLFKGDRVTLKECPYPFCQKLVFNTLRYRNLVKKYFQHVKNIKKMYLIPDETVLEMKSVVDVKLQKIWKLFYRTDANFAVSDVENVFRNQMHEVDNRRFSAILLQLLNYYADLLIDLGSHYSAFRQLKFSRSFPELVEVANEVRRCVRNIILALQSQLSKVSVELVDDLHCEVDRVHKMIDYCLMVRLGERVEARSSFNAFQSIFCAPGKFTEQRNDEVNDLIQDLQNVLQCSIPVASLMSKNVSETETMKTKLVHEKHGYWRVCENGHYFRQTESQNLSPDRACPRCNPPANNADGLKDLSDPFLFDVSNDFQ